jgi:hypothetical protein
MTSALNELGPEKQEYLDWERLRLENLTSKSRPYRSTAEQPGTEHFETSAREKGVDLDLKPSGDTRTRIETWQETAASERIEVSRGDTEAEGSVHSSDSWEGRSQWSVSDNAPWPVGSD